MFEEKFSAYVYHGESITCMVDGFLCTATIYNDEDCGPPWKEEDGHGPVSEWATRAKDPGERVLCEDNHGNNRRFYDFAAAVAIAKRDGWGAANSEGMTKGQIAVAAAEHDFAMLKAWCNDDWHYVGVAVTVSRDDIELTGRYDHACWGIEANYPDTDNRYLREVANDLLPEALDAAKEQLAKLIKKWTAA